MSKYKNNPKAKRFYWLKLKNDFFEQKEIKLLRKVAGGDTFTIIYLKMLLKSLKDDGCLFFESIGENFVEELSLDIDEDVENVGLTINFLQKKGLLEILDEDTFFLNRVPEMVGSESFSTERVRRHREKKILNAEETKKLHCNTDETHMKHDVTKSKSIVEQELYLEKKLEREQEQQQHKEKEQDIQLNQHTEKRERTAHVDAFENSLNFIECTELYENEFGELGKIDKNTLERLGKTYGIEFLYEAILKAVSRDDVKTPLGYITYLLREWHQKGFTSVEDIELEQEEFNEQFEDNST